MSFPSTPTTAAANTSTSPSSETPYQRAMTEIMQNQPKTRPNYDVGDAIAAIDGLSHICLEKGLRLAGEWLYFGLLHKWLHCQNLASKHQATFCVSVLMELCAVFERRREELLIETEKAGMDDEELLEGIHQLVWERWNLAVTKEVIAFEKQG